MKLPFFRFFVLLLAPLYVAADISITNSPSTGQPGEFAVEEIRRVATTKGMALPKSSIGPACRDFKHAEVMWEFFKASPTTPN